MNHFAKMKHSKQIFVIPILAVLIFGIIIMPALMPMIKSDPKDIPIGLVALDEGEIGSNLAEELPKNAPDIVKFINYGSVEELMKAMEKREVYGALEFPSDFSDKIATLMTDTPEKAKVNIYVNEGPSAMAANMVETALPNMIEMLNQQISGQMLANISEQSEAMKEQLEPILAAQGEDSPLAELGEFISPVQPDKVSDFANPVGYETIKVHEAGDLGNSPMAFITITWIGSIIGAVILYLTGTDRKFANRADKLKFNTLQSILPFVYGIIGGYVAVWYSTWILDFSFESINTVALYLGLTITAFIFMIFATLRWLRLPSVALYVIMMFFSMPAIQLPKEMMPAFHADYLYPWLPLRIFGDGLKEILFFSQKLINEYSTVMIWIILVGLILVWIKNLTEKVEIE